METLYLRKGEEQRLLAGHLWVFSNEVDVKRSPLTAFAPGQAVRVADSRERVLGTAYVNPASLIAARLVSRKDDSPLDADMLRARLGHALGLRERLFDRPFYRLCHGEGDLLPGLVVDRHGRHLTVQVSTAGMDIHTPAIIETLVDLLKPGSVFLDNTVSSRDLEGLSRGSSVVFGTVPEETVIEENGQEYLVSLKDGQKTGWFYDQRFNRAALAPFCGGASMLDAFCYAGGFGALAARHGARSVTFVDASASALAKARHNGEMASGHTEINTLKGDALEILAMLRREERRFDVICLDPPAFIKRRKDAKAGLEAYRRINELALDLLEPGGYLMTCSCSHHLEEAALQRMVAKGAAKRKMFCRMLRHGYQGPDHPVHPSMPETAYLKAYLFQSVPE